MSRAAQKKKLPGTYVAPPSKKRLRAVSAPEPPRVEERDRSRLPGAYLFALAAMGFGTLTGLALVVAALGLLASGPAQTSGGAAAPTPAAAEGHSHAPGTPEEHAHPAAPAEITVGVRQREGLQLDVRAKVTLQGNELTQARIAAYADMKAMPGAHAIGPVPLSEIPGQPGFYAGSLKLPMVGDYEVRVAVTDPITAESRKTIKVGTISKP